jgi:hypothetical protein
MAGVACKKARSPPSQDAVAIVIKKVVSTEVPQPFINAMPCWKFL